MGTQRKEFLCNELHHRAAETERKAPELYLPTRLSLMHRPSLDHSRPFPVSVDDYVPAQIKLFSDSPNETTRNQLNSDGLVPQQIII